MFDWRKMEQNRYFKLTVNFLTVVQERSKSSSLRYTTLSSEKVFVVHVSTYFLVFGKPMLVKDYKCKFLRPTLTDFA